MIKYILLLVTSLFCTSLQGEETVTHRVFGCDSGRYWEWTKSTDYTIKYQPTLYVQFTDKYGNHITIYGCFIIKRLKEEAE